MSSVNTFAYDLSAYLANILFPLTGKSEHTVTNSTHFVSTVSNETILDKRYQEVLWFIIIAFILMTLMLDLGMIVRGEIRY